MSTREGYNRRMEENITSRAENFVRQFGLTLYNKLKNFNFYVCNSEIKTACIEVLQLYVSQGISVENKVLKKEVFETLLLLYNQKAKNVVPRSDDARTPGECGTAYISSRRRVFKRGIL